MTFVFNFILSNIGTIGQDTTEKPHSSVGTTDEKDELSDTEADTTSKQPVSNVETDEAGRTSDKGPAQPISKNTPTQDNEADSQESIDLYCDEEPDIVEIGSTQC